MHEKGRNELKRTRLRAGLVQMKAGPDKAENFQKIQLLAQRAKEEGVELLVLPEVCTYRTLPKEELLGAEPFEGETVGFFRQLASQLGLAVLAGSFLEQPADDADPRAYNTSVLLDDHGEVVGCYRKIHLFDVRLPDGRETLESKTRRPGDRPVVLEWAGIKFGLSVCYDLRFPELYRALVLQGAQVIFVPSCFTMLTGKDHWEVLLRARAVENQVFVLAPNQIGAFDGMVPAYGRSLVADPWGNVLAKAPDCETLITATLELDLLNEVRSKMPVLEHIRLLPAPGH